MEGRTNGKSGRNVSPAKHMDTYSKRDTGRCILNGIHFQLDVLIVFLLNAVNCHGDSEWKISSENIKAEKFDDVVIELPNSSILLQAKFRSKDIITLHHLITSDFKAEFGLPKYFLSFVNVRHEFVQRSAIICTNANVSDDVFNTFVANDIPRNCLLYNEGASCQFLTFKEDYRYYDLKNKTITYLKKENEKQSKKVNNSKNTAKRAGVKTKEEITDEVTQEFLKNFQFFYNYPSGNELQGNIKRLLDQLGGLWRKISYKDIFSKIEHWFKQREGEYLKVLHSRAFLCEIRSDQYCESLRQFDMSFTDKHLNIVKSERIIHVKVERKYLLTLLKIYHYLRYDKVLFVNPKDSVNIQEEVVDTFSRHDDSFQQYSFLIMPWTAIEDEDAKDRIIKKLQNILQKNENKKIILISKTDLELTPFGQQKKYKIDEFVTFQDLTVPSQNKLLNRYVSFQGKKITFGELLPRQAIETINLNLEMLEELLTESEINVGKPLDTAPYLVDRKVKSASRTLTEQNLHNVGEKVVLISDSAGTGKSTSLERLAVSIKKDNPGLWVIKITLKDYTNVLNTCRNKNRNKINAEELLNSLEATKMANAFQKLIFSMNEKVVLMLDGADEISPDCTNLVLSLLNDCQEAPNFAKIFVTTRPYVDLKLEPFKLQPFNREEQVDFLTRHWIHNLNVKNKKKKKYCKRYAELLIDEISSWAISDTPLHLKFLGEIFTENINPDKNGNWESCREYLESGKDEPELRGKIRISRLCVAFIEKKRDIFISKENPSEYEHLTLLLAKEFDSFIDYYCKFAANSLKCQQQSTTIIPDDGHKEQYNLRIGILQNISGNWRFINKTFEEYFLAEFIRLNPSLVNDREICGDAFKNVRAIMGDMINANTNTNVFHVQNKLVIFILMTIFFLIIYFCVKVLNNL